MSQYFNLEGSIGLSDQRSILSSPTVQLKMHEKYVVLEARTQAITRRGNLPGGVRTPRALFSLGDSVNTSLISEANELAGLS